MFPAPIPATESASPSSSVPPSSPEVVTVSPKSTDALSLWDPVGSGFRVLTRERYYWPVAIGLLLWETCVTSAIILKVPYTEIDFTTYLEQASVFLSGERDYSLVKGETGPCVYPAGHLYAYSVLHYLTDGGRRLERAQWLFGAVYVATLAVVFGIYRRSERIPPYALVLLTISKRIHSLYVLRLFNDCLAMFFFYSALWLYTRPDTSLRQRQRLWMLGTCFFTIALSIKMSILLFLPALLYLLFVYHSPLVLVQHVAVLGITQILLASPFLTSPSLARSYLVQSFDFHREFLWEWTVNWRWIGVEVFEDPAWGKSLLLLHAAGLVVMANRWSAEEGGALALLTRGWRRPALTPARTRLTSTRVTTLFFTSNLLGVLCARSLHYQFYVWFYHSLVWLLWETWDGLGIEVMQRLVFLSLIEFGFFVFPSTVNSSLGLVLSMLVMIVVGWYGRPVGDQGLPVPREKLQ